MAFAYLGLEYRVLVWLKSRAFTLMVSSSLHDLSNNASWDDFFPVSRAVTAISPEA